MQCITGTYINTWEKREKAKQHFEGIKATARLACEQALLFGGVKRVSRERVSERRSREGRVLVRFASLAQIGELARRLRQGTLTYRNFVLVPPSLFCVPLARDLSRDPRRPLEES